MADNIINSFEDFHAEMKRYSDLNYSFRGHACKDWPLLPKVGRNDFVNAFANPADEQTFLGAWKRYSEHHLTRNPVDDWDWLSLAQHHGLATRLIDWSKNPLVALYFATENPHLDSDACIYILDSSKLDIDTDVNTPFQLKKSGTFYPKGLSARVINQRGVLSISHQPKKALNELIGDEKLKKIIISKTSIPGLRKVLKQYAVNEYSIYQDLDSLSKFLNRTALEYGNY